MAVGCVGCDDVWCVHICSRCWIVSCCRLFQFWASCGVVLMYCWSCLSGFLLLFAQFLCSNVGLVFHWSFSRLSCLRLW